MRIKIAPSILSADFGKLNEEIKEIEEHADYAHIDVMDGHFVNNITFGQVVVKDIKSKLSLDVHLMIENPEKYIEDFAKAGADIIVVHAETCNLSKVIPQIKALGVKAGIAINPDKELDLILDYIDDVEMVLLMTVFPGFGGQKFISDVLPRIKKLRELKPELDIEVDGGVNKDTIKTAVDAGANVIVAGSAVFGKENRAKAIEELRNACD